MTAPNLKKIKCCANCYFLIKRERTEWIEPASYYGGRVHQETVCELHDIMFTQGDEYRMPSLYVCDDFDSSKREPK